MFKDSHGVSVDRDYGRQESEVINTMEERIGIEDLRGIVYVEAYTCSEVGAIVKYVPLEDNPYHSEIHDSDFKPELTNAKARKLAKASKVVKIYWLHYLKCDINTKYFKLHF